MNKRLKVTGSLAGAVGVIGLLTWAVTSGFSLDQDTHAEEDVKTTQNQDVSDDSYNDRISDLQEPQVQKVSIHPGGHGLVIWDGQNGESKSIMFEISPDGQVDFLEKVDSPREALEDENVNELLVNSIQEEFEANKRSIYVMEGYMDGNQGTMQWVSHDRVHGEMRFVVEEDEEIIFNGTDWSSLPETDDHTAGDFLAAAENMIETYGLDHDYPYN